MAPIIERISGNQRSPGLVRPRSGAKRRLNRADRVENIKISVCDDVCRHSQRQEKRPIEDPAAGKVVCGDQPGRPGADDNHQDTPTPRRSVHVVARIAGGDDIGNELRPQTARPFGRNQGKRYNRGKNQCGDNPRRNRPGIIAGAAPAARTRCSGPGLLCSISLI